MDIMTWIHTAVIFISLAALLSIIRYTIQTGISPMPSSIKAKKAIIDELKHTGTGPVTDTGSGWGTLVTAIALNFPERKVAGYELSPLPWLYSVIRKKIYRLDNLTLYRKNFQKTSFSDTGVIVCYLFPGGMAKLQEKIERENPPVHTVISSTFAFPSVRPEKVLKLNDIYKTPVYVYRLNENQR